ncbi:MAG: type II toxin-antitoxin system RelE/ParE family toxin [Verrucomicrobia bacterium]|nr:type II toxin-antitoxin system RelE/ParE family toxin [Verrucomicrobiota bacterium]
MNRWFHPQFETELTAAAVYYEEQRAGLGAEFLDATEQAIETVMSAPHRWPARIGGVRRHLVERFPYLVRYRVAPTGETVQFLSLLHGARHPDTGRERE